MLVHTGWGRFWADAAKTLSGEPGLGKACAKWAVDQEIICWGCDQPAKCICNPFRSSTPSKRSLPK